MMSFRALERCATGAWEKRFEQSPACASPLANHSNNDYDRYGREEGGARCPSNCPSSAISTKEAPGAPLLWPFTSCGQPQRIPFCSNLGAHHVSGAQEDRLPLSAARTPHRITYDPTHCRAASSRVWSRGDIFESSPHRLYRMSPSGARQGIQEAECRLRVMGGEKRPKIWRPLRVDF